MTYKELEELIQKMTPEEKEKKVVLKISDGYAVETYTTKEVHLKGDVLHGYGLE